CALDPFRTAVTRLLWSAGIFLRLLRFLSSSWRKLRDAMNDALGYIRVSCEEQAASGLGLGAFGWTPRRRREAGRRFHVVSAKRGITKEISSPHPLSHPPASGRRDWKVRRVIDTS